MALSVLICEPQEVWAEEMKSFLVTNGFNTDCVHSGRDCQLNVYKNKYLAVILDLDTKNHSALEVLKYLRLNSPSIKVILTVQSKKRLEETGLNSEELTKLGVIF